MSEGAVAVTVSRNVTGLCFCVCFVLLLVSSFHLHRLVVVWSRNLWQALLQNPSEAGNVCQQSRRDKIGRVFALIISSETVIANYSGKRLLLYGDWKPRSTFDTSLRLAVAVVRRLYKHGARRATRMRKLQASQTLTTRHRTI